MRIDFFSAPLLVSLVFANTIPAQTVRSMTKLDTTGEVYFAAICNGGENVAGVGREKGIHLWNLATGQQKLFKADLDTQIDPGALACDQKTIAVGSIHGTVALLDFEGKVRKRTELKEEITGMALSPDGRKLTIGTANSPVQLWDVASGSREWSGSTTFGNTYGARISPDGKFVFATDGDTYVRAYNATDGKLVYAAEGDLLEPFDVSVSADGRSIAVAGAEGRVELRESASGKILKKSSSCGNPIFLVTMSPTAPTVLALILDEMTLHPAGIGYWNTNTTELKQLAIDPKTVIGMGSDAKGLLLVRQESPAKLSVDRVE
jgi:WD40 repeat protein